MVCAYCGRTREGTDDHCTPRARGGTDDAANRVVACRSCNGRKGTRQGRVAPCGHLTFQVGDFCMWETCKECRIPRAAGDPGMVELSHAASQAREWTARRDERIRELLARGGSLRTIGVAAGLSHTAVAKIAKRSI